MSLSQSLSTAFSGLTAAAKGAGIVATNMANQRTLGFGRRELLLGTSVIGGGVQVTGIHRHSNPVLLADRRLAGSATAAAQTRLGFHTALEGWLGLPGADGALGTRIGRFEATLAAAAAAPGTEARLADVLDAANSLAGHLRTVTEQVRGARTTADRGIGTDVALLNASLAQVAGLNREIRRMTALGQDPSALVDQRQTLVDKVAEVIPLREVVREGGQIALYSTGGATLLDGRPAEFGFTPAGRIEAGTTGLSGLTLNGRPVDLSGGAVAGGRLAANFALRDDLAPRAQMRIDAVARDLMTRMEGADTTRAPGSPGLFTDAGDAFDPATEPGLAGRIVVNAGADPARGGALWRLRAGMGAAVPGNNADGTLLAALGAALTDLRAPASGDFQPGVRSLAGLGSDLVSGVATARLFEDATATFTIVRHSALEQLEAEGGVDTDYEMQMLLTIERAYGANAKVIQAVDRMLDDLMGI